MSTYENLQVKFNDASVPVYSEFIVGLPGENYESWKKGLDEIAAAGMRNQVMIYPCAALNNTDMADPEYRSKFGYQTRCIELAEIHGTVRPPSWVTEYEDIVISTSSMDVAEWRKMMVYSWLFMLLHGLKVGYFVMVYLQERHGRRPSELIEKVLTSKQGKWRDILGEFERVLDRTLEEGKPLAVVLPAYGNVYWALEEAAFLRMMTSGALPEYMDELSAFAQQLVPVASFDELDDALGYQQAVLPEYATTGQPFNFLSHYNFHEYFRGVYTSTPVELRPEMRLLVSSHRQFTNLRDYARDVVVHGRKSNTMLRTIQAV
jgi:putative methyltransferase